ncbi:MAG: endolytic transglycosylase MltG [Xanthomonadales bacterium]|nr:endolytic transglycosylase MltG [Xanthomonadales bacterium]
MARTRRPRGRIRWGLLVVLLLLAVAGAAGALYVDWMRFTETPLAVGQRESIDIPRGTTFKGVVRQLRREGLTRGSPAYWRLLAEDMGVAGKLHAGEYALAPGLTPRELLRRMAAGEVILHRFTIVDGWSFRQLRLGLAAEAGLAQTLPGLADGSIAERLGIADGRPEGWFLPETYAWVKGESDLDVLRRSHQAMQKALDAAWAGREAELKLESPYEALILASIVEKETAVPAERSLIAGVFLRRLDLGMRLQTDPTVIYGMGEGFDGNIRKRNLETDTPWNTYTREGLPPTPIALPGKPALQAVMHPASGDALYFVARGDGSHEFSATLAEHNRAVARYQLRKGR